MDEDRLSPQLGRLIDEAKAEARLLDIASPDAEGVALLTGSGAIHRGAVTGGSAEVGSAAGSALARAQAAGDAEIIAAAVAAPFHPGETVLPSAESRRCLAGIDPELPLVIKQHGRWVMLPASKVGPS
jgi:hypothetical protein